MFLDLKVCYTLLYTFKIARQVNISLYSNSYFYFYLIYLCSQIRIQLKSINLKTFFINKYLFYSNQSFYYSLLNLHNKNHYSVCYFNNALYCYSFAIRTDRLIKHNTVVHTATECNRFKH